jgi:uncharacterized integral membrane protein (TIGR00698 family)
VNLKVHTGRLLAICTISGFAIGASLVAGYRNVDRAANELGAHSMALREVADLDTRLRTYVHMADKVLLHDQTGLLDSTVKWSEEIRATARRLAATKLADGMRSEIDAIVGGVGRIQACIDEGATDHGDDRKARLAALAERAQVEEEQLVERSDQLEDQLARRAEYHQKDIDDQRFALAVVTATFFGTRWLGRRLGLGHGMSMLVATGCSICGASAIAAAEPFSDAAEEEVAYSVALVTLCGSLAIVVLPPLGRWFGLDSQTFGAWVGASVHDVGQVVAAASTRDTVALSTAVVVKLTRVAMLAPLLAFVAVAARQRAARGEGRAPGIDAKRPPLLPLFVVLFLAAVALRTVGAVPVGWLDGIKTIETVLLGAGLVGLGSAVDLRRLRVLGGRPLVLGLVSWALVAGVSLLAVQLSF